MHIILFPFFVTCSCTAIPVEMHSITCLEIECADLLSQHEVFETLQHCTVEIQVFSMSYLPRYHQYMTLGISNDYTKVSIAVYAAACYSIRLS